MVKNVLPHCLYFQRGNRGRVVVQFEKHPVNKPLRTSAGMSLRKIRIVPSASGAAGVDDFSSADSAMAATPNRTAKTLSLQSIFCSNSVRSKTFVENKLLVFRIYFVFFFFFLLKYEIFALGKTCVFSDQL